MSASEILRRDAMDQAEAVDRGEVSAPELVDAAIERIGVLDPAIGAVVSERFDRARVEAAGPLPDGPFRGVPFLLKDAVQESEGDRYQHGSAFLRDHPLVSPADTGLTRRYRLAGFVQLGRTKVPELTMSSTTEPLAFGPTHNPWNLSHSSGGSSGGSAAAVAAGMVPAAHGNDMGGSIRIPASCCGLVGLKPSRGRTTLAPGWGMYWGPLTHEHVLTRSVRDSAAVLDATAGPTPGDLYEAPPPSRPWLDEVAEQEVPRLRVGLMLDTHGGGPVDPQCSTAAQSTARLLEELGHSVEPFDAAALHDTAGAASMGAVIAASVARDISRWEELVGATVQEGDLEPMTAASLAGGRAMGAAEYVEHLDVLARWSRRIAQATGTFDVIVSPTMAVLPPSLGTISADRPLADAIPVFSAMTGFALPFDISGQPAVSLPLHWSNEGLPVGVQLVAAYGREDLLFRLAGQLERARPWADRWPAIASS
jgi:amidase